MKKYLYILDFKWQIKVIQVFLLLPFTVIIYVKLGITHPQAETSGRQKKTTEEIFSMWNLSSSQSPKRGRETLTVHFSNKGRKKGL